MTHLSSIPHLFGFVSLEEPTVPKSSNLTGSEHRCRNLHVFTNARMAGALLYLGTKIESKYNFIRTMVCLFCRISPLGICSKLQQALRE